MKSNITQFSDAYSKVCALDFTDRDALDLLKEIERIDKPKAGQIHVHQKGKGATNADGTIHDKGKGAPEWSNKVVKWLRNYGFNI